MPVNIYITKVWPFWGNNFMFIEYRTRVPTVYTYIVYMTCSMLHYESNLDFIIIGSGQLRKLLGGIMI